MSEKTEVDQEYEDGNASPVSVNLPQHQYTREELFDLSKSPASRRRPDCLETKYDTDDGHWDPERWYKAKYVSSREASPLTLSEGKDRRRGLPDLDVKRRPSVNEPLERVKEKDVIVLSPQRRSFGTGCHVQNPPSYTRQLSIPERDEPKVERDRDRDRDRERQVRKIGSGRIQIDKENYRERDRERDRDRDRYDDRDIRDRDRDRDFTWNRDRDRNDRDREWDRDIRGDRDRDRDRDRSDRDREWERDVRVDRDRDRDRDFRDLRDDWDRERDRRYDRSDRFRRPNDRDYPDRDRRDREYHNRDRGYDKHSRRRPPREEEKEPEWFTEGPTSQMETIELRGFDRTGETDMDEGLSLRPNSHKQELRKRTTPPNHKSFKDSHEEVHEPDVKVSQRSSPEEDQQVQPAPDKEKSVPAQQHLDVTESVATDKDFDINDIFNSVPLPGALEAEGQKVSRFSRFFSARGANQMDGDAVSMESNLMPQGLLEDSRSSPAVPSPVPHLQQQHGLHPFLHFSEQQHQAYMDQHLMQDGKLRQQQQQHYQPELLHSMMMGSVNVPTSAGDNSTSARSVGGAKAAGDGGEPLPASVTAFFSAAAASSTTTPGGSNAPISGGSSFSSHDASLQLKAMLFGGPSKESAPSSGTASPASLPPGVQHKVKTLAELEADLHQDSPKLVNLAPAVTTNTGPPGGPLPGNIAGSTPLGQDGGGSGDMTAFNKLLFMMNVAPEANQNSGTGEGQTARVGQPMIPSHSQFTTAVLRNKEEQKLLQQQSLQSAQQLPMLHNMPPPTASFPPPGMPHNRMGGKMLGLPPQAMSTPAASVGHQQQRPHSSSSTDPILSLIQQNPAIVMKPPSPAISMAALFAAQQQQQHQHHMEILGKSARVPSPLMFSQQPPQHLSAPSPIRTGQLSPGSLGPGDKLPPNSGAGGGPHSPVLQQPRGLSPQELSAHAQAVMQSALIKKQLEEQSKRYYKKHPQERAKSPSQLQQLRVVKPQPAALPVLPPNPQPKGSALNTFTPTSVMKKMHNDKAMVKERQSQEGKSEEEMDFMPSMHEAGNSQGSNELFGSFHGNQLQPQRPASASEHLVSGGLGNSNSNGKVKTSFGGDILQQQQQHHSSLSDISFLDPVNPDLVAMSNQMESQLCISGEAGGAGGRSGMVLPGTLSQPMTVEEKMKMSALAEKPGYLSQMLDKSKAAAEARLRPIVKGDDPNPEERNLAQQLSQNHMLQQQLLQQHQQQHHHQHLQQQQQQQGGRAVTGSGVSFHSQQQQQQMFPPSASMAGPPPAAPPLLPQAPAPSAVQQQQAGKGASGRAIVGTSSVHQQQQGAEMLRFMEQQQQQHMQQYMQTYQPGMVLPPPPLGAPMGFPPGPPPVAIPMAIPVSGAPGARLPLVAGHPALIQQQQQQQQQQQMARVNALTQQRHQQHQHLYNMALQQQQQQQRSVLGPLHAVVSGTGTGQQQLSPRGSQGPLSPAALTATIQRVASPHGGQLPLNGPLMSGMNGGGPQQQQRPQGMAGKIDVGGGIQRWFSPDILKTQLPSMPPLPTQGNKVMTVDELERA